MSWKTAFRSLYHQGASPADPAPERGLHVDSLIYPLFFRVDAL